MERSPNARARLDLVRPGPRQPSLVRNTLASARVPSTVQVMSDPIPTILVVDDDADAHFLLGRKLLKGDIQGRIVSCHDGLEAVSHFEKCLKGEEPWPGIVFLDIKMPGMNGFEVLDWLRAREALGRTMVAMHTTSSEARDVHDAYSRGAHAFLTKDVTPDNLAPIVRSALRLAMRAPQRSIQ